MSARAWPLLFGLLLVAAGACSYSPRYQGSACADQEPRCPAGFACLNGVCQRESDSDDGEPLHHGDDGGALDDDVGPGDGGDACCPGDEDDGADAGYADDGGADGAADGGVDDGDGAPGGDDPCASRQCPGGYYCNPATGTCQPCQTEAACGSECLACSPGETCDKLGAEYCCRPSCTAETACREIACGASGWICALKFNPERWEWNQQGQGGAFCTLAPPGQPGENLPVAGTFTCLDETTLGFYCTYDGNCSEGSCQPDPDPAVQKHHNCGEVFGCNAQSNRCYLHRKNGSACKFNYDCQSFCCSREQNATCLDPAPDRSNCKIAETEYWSDGTRYTWVAYDADTPHDIASWSSRRGHDGPTCQNDTDCDSGKCYGGSDKTCHFASCMGYDPEDNHIRSHYFCSAGVGDGSTQVYRDFIENPNPEPDRAACPSRRRLDADHL